MLSTYQALHILEILGEEPRRRPERVQWLHGQWDQMKAQAGSGEAGVTPLSLLAVCLYMLDPSDSRLQDAWQTIARSVEIRFSHDDQNPEFLLMDMAAAVQAAEKLGAPNGWVPHTFTVELELLQNRDGGFNAFLSGESEHLGTYLAARVLQYAGRDGAWQQSLLNLIDLYETPGGGYSPMISRPISLTATRGVLQSAAHLQVPLHKDGLATYLSDLLHRAVAPDEIHLALDSARLAEVRVTVLPDRLMSWAAVMAPLAGMEELDRLYHTVAALRILDAEIPEAVRDSIQVNLYALRNKDGGFGPDGRSNLDTTVRVAAILVWIGAEPADRSVGGTCSLWAFFWSFRELQRSGERSRSVSAWPY